MKKAFTLAEILITLGIIGIVTALTLPALTAKYKKHVTETSLKRFYTNMNQAIKLSEIDNGDKINWFGETPPGNEAAYSEEVLTSFYEKYLKKYLRTLKTEYYNNPSGNNGFLVYFHDGSVVRIAYYGKDYNYCLSYKEMMKGLQSSQNRGKTCFVFGMYPEASAEHNVYQHNAYYNKGMEPYVGAGWDGTYEHLYTNHDWYTKIIQMNGWKIPNDYPIKF